MFGRVEQQILHERVYPGIVRCYSVDVLVVGGVAGRNFRIPINSSWLLTKSAPQIILTFSNDFLNC